MRYIKSRITMGAVIWVLVLALSSCESGKSYVGDKNWAALSTVLHTQLITGRNLGPLSSKQVDQIMTNLHVETIEINDLSELRNVYFAAYVEPHLDDEITEAFDRMIERQVATKLWLEIGGKRFPPTAVYVIVNYDRATYQAQLENTYADDSIHIPEFPESFSDTVVKREPEKAIRLHIESPFKYLVRPRYYEGHSWKPIDMEMDANGTLKVLPNDASQYVMFAIVAEKGISNRQYKGIWVVEN